MPDSSPNGFVFDVEDLHFRYPGRDQDALAGVTVRIPAGQVICLVGPNGSGKSTLLYLLGLLAGQPRQGRISYRDGPKDVEYSTLDDAGRIDLRRRRFGFALQDAYLMPQLTCTENLAMPLLLQGTPRPKAFVRAKELLGQLGDDMAALADREGGDTLSGGQRKMMAVLRALVHEPTVVFADEPIDSADAANRERVLGLLCGWQQENCGRTLLLVLHDLALACRLGQSFILLTHDHHVRDDRAFRRDEIFQEAQRDNLTCVERLERWVAHGR